MRADVKPLLNMPASGLADRIHAIRQVQCTHAGSNLGKNEAGEDREVVSQQPLSVGCAVEKCLALDDCDHDNSPRDDLPKDIA